MKKAFNRSIALAIALFVCGLTGTTGQARADVANNCCTFRVAVAAFPAGCFPIAFNIGWVGYTQSISVASWTPGGQTFTIPNSNCIVPPALSSVTVAGFTYNPPSGGGSSSTFRLPCGECVRLNVVPDPMTTGCLLIQLLSVPGGC